MDDTFGVMFYTIFSIADLESNKIITIINKVNIPNNIFYFSQLCHKKLLNLKEPLAGFIIIIHEFM